MARIKNQVVILHGWSDTSDAFVPLSAFLRTNGYQTVSLFLADYLSMDDDVAIDDAARAMEFAIKRKMVDGTLKLPFDLLVHSTGGLVARAWLANHYTGVAAAAMPVERLLMLAPANFGSRLATMGQSILGRIVKGWGHGLHTGKRMLDGLELGSPFQWGLAASDLFLLDHAQPGTIYGEDLVWPFVLVGSEPYRHGLRQLANEVGSDGTVRVAAANLNAYGATLDFTRNDAPEILGMTAHNNAEALAHAALMPWTRRFDENMEFPLLVLPHRDHAGIIDPATLADGESAQQQADYQKHLLAALSCPDFATYQALQQAWRNYSDQVQDPASSDANHQMHMQINTFVVDEYQAPVADYMIEFLAPNYEQTTDLAGLFHEKVLRDVHQCQQNAAIRTLYLDRQRLFALFYAALPEAAKELRLSISATAPGDNVKYFLQAYGGRGEFIVHSQAEADRWLHRNATHFLKIIIPRVPMDDVFKLKNAP